MVRLTDHLFPIVIFQAMGECGPSDVDAAEGGYREVFKRQEKFISVSDARRSANHAAQRKLWADLTARLLSGSMRWTVCTVIILDSAALRAALTAVNWITKPNIPQYVVKSPEEACTEAAALAKQHGLTLPEHFDEDFLAWVAEGVTEYEASQAG